MHVGQVLSRYGTPQGVYLLHAPSVLLRDKTSQLMRELRACDDAEYVDWAGMNADPTMYDLPDFWHPPIEGRVELSLVEQRKHPVNCVSYQIDPMFLGLVRYTQVFPEQIYGRLESATVRLPASSEDDQKFRIELDAVLERTAPSRWEGYKSPRWAQKLPDAPYQFRLGFAEIPVAWENICAAERRLLRFCGAMVRAHRTGRWLVTPYPSYLHPNLVEALIREAVQSGVRWVLDSCHPEIPARLRDTGISVLNIGTVYPG